MSLKEEARDMAECSFEMIMNDDFLCYDGKYEEMTYDKRMTVLTEFKKEINRLIDEKIKEEDANKNNTVDEMALLRAENKRLKEELAHAHDWDNYDPSTDTMGQ